MLYMLQNIPWTTNNIICLVLMGVAVWVASMIGYDKLLQLVRQIADLPKSEKKEVKSDESSNI